jgi:transmembrane sensor
MESTENLKRFDERTNKSQLLEDLVLYEKAEQDKQEMKSRIAWDSYSHRRVFTNPSSFARKKLMAAASILIITSLGILFWLQYGKKEALAKLNISRISTKTDIAPGGNKAYLFLSNGSRISLDSIGNGIIGTQGKSKLVKQGDNQLIYKTNSQIAAVENIGYNTLETPNAGQFEVALPDGSQVWLNNASTLKYPTSFSGKERQVELTGEAYFRVIHNKKMPFRVLVGMLTVQDVGTSFNIKAYQNEASIQTTVVEGEAKVTGNSQSILVHPGKQALVDEKDNLIVKDANVKSIVAWKKGFFSFDNSNLQSVLRQLARWYNLDIKYETKISEDMTFDGVISRNTSLTQVLKLIEKNGIHYKLIENTLTIIP